MKTLGVILLVSVLVMPWPVSAAPSAQGRGNSDQGRGPRNGTPSNPVHPVPEPSTLILLGAAAGIAGARKIWQRRRSR